MMKKFISVLAGAALCATFALGFAACTGDPDDNDDQNNNGGGEYELADGMFDIDNWKTGADTRLTLEVTEAGTYRVDYDEVFRNEYIAVSADVNIDLSQTNTITFEYKNLGEKSVNVSIEFMDAEGNTGYGGGNLAVSEEKSDVINMELCHQYGAGVPLGTVKQIQIFFDSGYSSNSADLTAYSGSIEISSVKLSNQEEEAPELPGENDVKLPTAAGDLWTNATTLTTDNDTKTVERITAAGASGDYGNFACLNYTGMNAACNKIVFNLGAETDFDMLMIQVQIPKADGDGNDEVVNYQKLTPTSGETQLVIDLTPDQAQKMADTANQYFMIWMDANSGNGLGKLVITSVEFWAPEGTEVPDESEPTDPDQDEVLLETEMGDLWQNSGITSLTTDNDTKTVERVTAAGESGDYGSWVALNYTGMSADCRKIVITLGEGTSCDMLMLQVQDASNGEIVNCTRGTLSGDTQIVIELTAEQAQKMAETPNQYFMIWLDANSGNGTGKVVIESIAFYAIAE